MTQRRYTIYDDVIAERIRLNAPRIPLKQLAKLMKIDYGTIRKYASEAQLQMQFSHKKPPQSEDSERILRLMELSERVS